MDLRAYDVTKMRVLGNNVLVREHEVFYGTKNFIVAHVKDGQKRGQFAGEVLAVGPGKYTKKGVLVPPPYKVGDKVIFGLYHGRRLSNHKPHIWLLDSLKMWGTVDEFPEFFNETKGRKVD